jgi:single-stranded-DNA-specific exonuclease
MSFADFEKKTAVAISELNRIKSPEIILAHHDDADGLCSGAITKTALEREKFRVSTLCLEKVYPEVIKDLHNAQSGVIFYSDIGSGHADFISEANEGRNLTIILDHHHNAPSATDPLVFDLNLEQFGFQGETEFSGATCSYLFAKALNKDNTDLSYLALVGSREIPGDYVGLNEAVLEEAEKNGVVKLEAGKMKIARLKIRADDLFARLQILGAVGYYDGGPEMGIQTCLNGITDYIKQKIDEWEEKRKKANKRVIAWLYRQGLKESKNLQWFDAGGLYKGMGTKVIGQFCSFLSYQTKLIKPDKYILGFMNVPLEVPGWSGKLKGPLVKVSIRLPRTLHDLIDRGEMTSAVDLVTKASKSFGIADGHKYAANVVIPVDKKDALLENCDSFAKTQP